MMAQQHTFNDIVFPAAILHPCNCMSVWVSRPCSHDGSHLRSSSLVCSYSAGIVYRSDGALGVGMVNAMRGAIIALIAGVWFCSEATPWQCLTPLSAASAAIVTSGSIMWVNATTLAKVSLCLLLVQLPVLCCASVSCQVLCIVLQEQANTKLA